MILRQLGNSSLTVSALGFGAGHIDTTDLSEKDAHDLLDTALDLGVTFFDTARGYGASEERLGRWLPSHRDRVVLSTKVGYDVPGQQDWTAGAVTGGIDRALTILNTEVIDVVFLHSCPLPVLQQGDLIEALLAARDAGKIRLPGYSGENTELAWAADAGVFGVLQTSVNLTDQHSLRHTLPRARERHIGVVAKRPLANAPWRYTQRPTGIYGETYWDRLQHMGLGPGDGDWAGTALRFSAFSPGISTAIVGTSNKNNLMAAAEAIGKGPLPAAERQRWEQAFAPPRLRMGRRGLKPTPSTFDRSDGAKNYRITAAPIPRSNLAIQVAEAFGKSWRRQFHFFTSCFTTTSFTTTLGHPALANRPQGT